MDPFRITITIGIVLVVIWRIVRGSEVRLVLFCAALGLGLLVGQPWLILDKFFESIGDKNTIGPICTAMGFAFVIRATGCDKEMVKMLLRPIQNYRWLLIPGGCAVGFITNMAITSQTATAAAVGAVLLPLMIEAGISPLIAGATLVLGCSAGGNLFNPGEPDIVYIVSASGASTHDVLSLMVQPELVAFAVAVLVFVVIHRNSTRPLTHEKATSLDFNVVKALLPPLPIAILFVCFPSFGWFPYLQQLYPRGLPVSHVMIVSTAIVMLINRKEFSAITRHFFDGLGYGFVQVISLIVTAGCFIEGLRLVGAVDLAVGFITEGGALGELFSGVTTMALAVISGSGTAPSVSFSQAVLPSIAKTNLLSAIDLGVIGAIGATFGRTMSPVAAVVIYAAIQLPGIKPIDIVKKTSIPLLVGFVFAFAIVAFR